MELLTFGKKIIVLLLVILIITTPLLTQELNSNDDYYQGKVDGERDAHGNLLWIAAGFLFPYGNIAAYLIKPNPPVQAFMGKSAQYILGYKDGYQKKAALKNFKYSCLGSGILVAVIIAAAASDDGSCGPDISCGNNSGDSCGGDSGSCSELTSLKLF